MEDQQLLYDLEMMIDELQLTNSLDEKEEILSRYNQFIWLLKAIYDPRYTFGVTRKGIENYMSVNVDFPYRHYFLVDLLKDLNNRSLTGHNALNACASYINDYPDYENIILNIFDKDLKTGIGYITINAVYPKLIPEFNAPLAKDYDDNTDLSEGWMLSRKLDGIRCLCFMHDGVVEFYSRNGLRFTQLSVLEEELKNYGLIEENYDNIILDGEICIMDENGIEDFSKAAGELKRKNHTIQNPMFFIFDVYTIDEFSNGKCIEENYKERYENLLSKIGGKYFKPLEQVFINSKEEVENMLSILPDEWEGYILRKAFDYTKFSRSKNLLKLKKWKEAEFIVNGVYEGDKYINGITQRCISGLIISYKGYTVGVGSGLTDSQRLEWYADNSKIVGKSVTIKYFNESKNLDGGLSLRFPIFKGIRDYE